ncbi:MAG: exonuclease SbcCD subunit D [Pseudomonadota bacterium]
MRLLHTADWHLGRTLHGYPLLEDQAKLLTDITTAAVEFKADAVLVAGDVFDRAVPPPEAVEVLDEVLYRLIVEQRLPVIMIAGNHDSPRRLSFGARLMQPQGLIIRTDLQEITAPIVLQDGHGQLDIFALPYVEPAIVNLAFGITTHSHHDAMQAVISRLPLEPGRRKLAMAHLFLQGGAESESERPLTVGTLEGVSPELFAPFDYVALGHLHRPQSWSDGRIRYSGSLMRMSFDEADHEKSFTLIEIDRAGKVETESVVLKPGRQVELKKGYLNELMGSGPSTDFISVELLDEGAVLDAHGRLREVFSNLCEVRRPHYRPAVLAGEADRARTDRSTGELFADFFETMTGDVIPIAERNVFETAYRDFSAAEREAGA